MVKQTFPYFSLTLAEFFIDVFLLPNISNDFVNYQEKVNVLFLHRRVKY